jgi:hypothetical protein
MSVNYGGTKNGLSVVIRHKILRQGVVSGNLTFHLGSLLSSKL